MNSFVEGVRSGMEKSTGRPVSRNTARAVTIGLGVAVVAWFWWMNQPETPTRTIRVTAAEWGARWPYPGFSEGLLWCKMSHGSPATFIRLGKTDFGTNGVAYDMPGVLPDRGLLKRAERPYDGIDSAAGDGAQAQLELAKTLCR